MKIIINFLVYAKLKSQPFVINTSSTRYNGLKLKTSLGPNQYNYASLRINRPYSIPYVGKFWRGKTLANVLI